MKVKAVRSRSKVKVRFFFSVSLYGFSLKQDSVSLYGFLLPGSVSLYGFSPFQVSVRFRFLVVDITLHFELTHWLSAGEVERAQHFS